MGIQNEIYSTKIRAGIRTYFFNVKKNKHGDKFLNLVESKKAGENDFERHSLIIFEEDLKEFLDKLNETANYVLSE